MTEEEKEKLIHEATQTMIKLKERCESYEIDEETAHGDADDLLMEFLNKLGYAELAKAFDDVPKWYS